MPQCHEKTGGMAQITSMYRVAVIIADHRAQDSNAPVLMEKILRQCRLSDFGDMLVLANGIDLVSRETGHVDALFKSYHGSSSGPRVSKGTMTGQ